MLTPAKPSDLASRIPFSADRLDQLLVRQGVITPDQVQKSLELQARTPHKRIGQILIEMSAISLEQLHATVKAQVQNLVLSLFTWAEGKYLFEQIGRAHV